MSIRKFFYMLIAGAASTAILLSTANAQARDPCTVATGGVTECKGPNCALDPDVELANAWRPVANCILPLRTAWSRHGANSLVRAGNEMLPVADVVRDVIYRAMTQSGAGAALADEPGRYVPMKTVLLPDLSLNGRVVGIAQLNNLGQPYNGMSQTAMARILFNFAAMAQKGGYPAAARDAKAYRTLAEAAVATAIAPSSQGGLASVAPCSEAPELRCAWFHSVTRPDVDFRRGATLNQNLHVIRDLILIVNARAQADWPADPAYTEAIGEGLNQLFLSRGHVAPGLPPNMADFLATPGDGPSWAYYGFNPERGPPAGAYFLNHPGSNCSYHYHVLDLMAAILQRAEELKISPQATEKAVACTSPLYRMYEAIAGDAPPPPNAPAASDGNWCLASLARDRTRTIQFMQSTFASCSSR